MKDEPITSPTENNPPPNPLRRRLTFILHPSSFILLFILLFAFFFSLLALRQHQAFQTNGLDLGNVDQALWNTAHGHFLRFTLMTPVQSRLALHVEPILLLFVPLYWLDLGGPKALLIIQATVVALGAWPLYQLALHNLRLPITNYQLSISNYQLVIINYVFLVFPLAYLMLPTLQAAVLFDFHAVTLAPTFFLFAFWALDRKKDRSFIIFALLAMACKEDMPLVVAMMGLYAGLARRRWRLAGLTLGLSIVWFVIAFFVIQPRFAGGGNIQLDRYAWLGSSLPEMLQTIITQPGLVFDHLWRQAHLPDYLGALFFPTAFLACFSPLTLLPLLPTLAVNLLSDNPFTWRLEDFHYGAPLAPFLFIATIYGIRNIVTWIERHTQTEAGSPIANNKQSPPHPGSPAPLLTTMLTVLLLLFSGIYHYHRGFTPLARPFDWPRVTDHHDQLQQYLPQISPTTALFTQSNLAPHLTQRQTIYTDFGYFTDPNFPAEPVDDILLDITGFENSGGLHQFLRQTLLDSDSYYLVAAQDGILHFAARPMTNDERPTTPEEQTTTDAELPSPTPYFLLPTPFYTFAHPDSPPDYRLALDFGELVRLHGYSLHFNRQEEVQVSVDLEPLQPLTDVQPVLYLLDATGEPKGATTDRQPTLVWFPVEQWPLGETVRVRFNTLPWHTRETKAYRLALGLISGDDVWDISRRHPPTRITSPVYALRLSAAGTLVELARIEQTWHIPAGGPVLRQFAAPRPPHRLRANFNHLIQLLGYGLFKSSSPLPDADSQISLTLYWQALTAPPNLTRFVQLIGPDGQIYSQNDSAPDRGSYPTDLWQPNEYVAETVILPLPAERPAGTYTLHLGLYQPDTGQRLPLAAGGDHIELTHSFLNVKE